MSVLNPIVQEVVDNLANFIENINCIHETFGYSEIMLREQYDKSQKNYEDFIKKCRIEENNGQEIAYVPDSKYRQYLKLYKKKKRAEHAFKLIPPSYLVTLVSEFDSFFAGLVRSVFNICPEKLQESDMTFCYRDLQCLESIKDVKIKIIDKCIENLLRESHTKQFNWLAKALDVETLTKFDGWKEFVELTERRNLFVHANGIVSNQYKTECEKCGYLLQDIILGMQLSVDRPYFEKSYRLLYKISIMLSQMLLRSLYLPKNVEDSSVIDEQLIINVYELISEELYDVAISVSEFALNNKKFKHNSFDRGYIVLNLAQAYKWSENDDKCQKILESEDWSASTNELLMPMYALKEDYNEVFKRMRELGNSNKNITISSYLEWPIFKLVREQKDFKIVFEEIFGEKPIKERQIEIEQNNFSAENSQTKVS
jgi:hypothetical protein